MNVEGTESERLFEQFCATNDVQYVRIETKSASGERTPDYEIRTSCGGRVAVEVKQFNPTEEEKRLYQQLQERGYTDSYGSEPGAKARLKIQSGAKQLKAYADGHLPTLLVLYSNVPFPRRGVDPYEIKTAMYGIEKTDITLDGSSGAARVSDRGFGPKRKMTPTSNTSLSAVGTLLDSSESGLMLVVYHNKYASNPLPVSWLQTPQVKHFMIEEKRPGEFQEWVQCTEQKECM
jgi:hypothetical protein